MLKKDLIVPPEGKADTLKAQEAPTKRSLSGTAILACPQEAILLWFTEQIPLSQAFLVALSLHVIMLPVLWIIGWALPWPESDPITTVIEYDLRGWPNVAKPKRVFDYYDSEKSK